MIKVPNKYDAAHDFLAASKWKKEYGLDQILLPSAKIQSRAFKDGCLSQLMACCADLRLWAIHFQAHGKKELAKELEQFASDWSAEGKEYLD